MNWEKNASFSASLPRFQTSLDSTSLGTFKTCPRLYYYSIICGYAKRGSKIDLDFGIAAHRVVEVYHKIRADGTVDHELALEYIIKEIMESTWDYENEVPFLDDPQKNRLSLCRFAVEYLDHYERDGTGPRTLILESGKPAVELSFAFDSGIEVGGEPIILCGHLDRLVEFNGETFIADVKTTRNGLGTNYAKQFTPDNQFTLYTIAGKVALGVQAKGVLLDAAQIGTNFVRLGRYLVPRPQGVLDEWLRGLRLWVGQMYETARWAETEAEKPVEEQYPQNDKACGMYGGCAFREVCGRSPSARQPILDSDFELRKWDPIGNPR